MGSAKQLVAYIAVLEAELDTWHTIAAQRDIPATFLDKIHRLAQERADKRMELAAEIDAHKEANPAQAKHGELA